MGCASSSTAAEADCGADSHPPVSKQTHMLNFATYLDAGIELKNEGQYKEAETYLRKAVALLSRRDADLPSEQYAAYLELATVLIRLGHLKKAEPLLDQYYLSFLNDAKMLLSKGDYTPEMFLRAGRFGRVHTGIHFKGDVVALKYYGYTHSTIVPKQTEILREIATLYELREVDGVMKILGYYQDSGRELLRPREVDSALFPVLVTEYLESGDVFEHILLDEEPVSEYRLSAIIRKIAVVVYQLHEKEYIHCNIQPENILCSEVSVGRHKDISFKLINFRKARKPSESLISLAIDNDMGEFSEYDNFCMAPELRDHNRPNTDRPYSYKSDVWQIGCVLYSFLCCSDFLDTLMGGDEWSGISAEAKNLLSQCFALEPEDRITVVGILNHPWILRSDLVSEEPFPDYKPKLRLLATTRKLKKILFDCGINVKNSDVVSLVENFPVIVNQASDYAGNSTDVSVEVFGVVMEPFGLQESTILNIFNAFDIERSGKIDFPHFLDAMRVITTPDSNVVSHASHTSGVNMIDDKRTTSHAVEIKDSLENDSAKMEVALKVALQDSDSRISAHEAAIVVSNVAGQTVATEIVEEVEKKRTSSPVNKSDETVGLPEKMPVNTVVSAEKKGPEEHNRVSAGLAARMAALGGVQSIRLPGMPPSGNSKIMHNQRYEEVKASVDITHKTLDRVKVNENRQSKKVSKKFDMGDIDGLVTPIG